MKKYSPIEYILIDISNSYGMDKELFETRINWCKENASNLTSLAQEADDYPMYMKGIMALRTAVDTGFSNHMVGLDATASGVQVLSALTGCIQGGAQVGMVDPEKRCDVYTALMSFMNKYLPLEKHIGYSPDGFSRQDLKDPLSVR